MKQLYTRWGREFNPSSILQEYPRPMMVRDSYYNLNGKWDYTFTTTESLPSIFSGKIYVPFSPESVLSDVKRQLQPDEYLWYKKEIPISSSKLQAGYGLFLHFGAIDQTATIYVNNQEVYTHVGGYLPFSVELTPYIKNNIEALTVIIRVKDVSDTSYHARGKQKLHRGGMYYTAQSGIWQTVWMEYVPKTYISKAIFHASPDEGKLAVHLAFDRIFSDVRKLETISEPLSLRIYPAKIIDEPMTTPASYFAKLTSSSFIKSHTDIVNTSEAHFSYDIQLDLLELSQGLWSPEHPYLFEYEVNFGQDHIAGYFAARTISKEKDADGIMRICINHEPVFQRGVLDQGYWPDGLMTPPSDEAFIFDIQGVKDLGYNMIRKHIKIEPQRFYYHCDRLGMFVWQDMVNGGEPYKDWYVTYIATIKSALQLKTTDLTKGLLSRRNKTGREEWEAEMLATIELLKEHPSICTWVIFNEGWGQFDTVRLCELARNADDSRLIDATSGWYDQGCGDMNSFHNYFFSMKIPKDLFHTNRLVVCSEFGGYSYAIPDHCTGEGLYGYGTHKSFESLQAAFEKREGLLQALIPQGLCASVYTQISDIEDEVNGIFTYDREIQKLH